MEEIIEKIEVLRKYDSPWYYGHFDGWQTVFKNAPERFYKKNEIVYQQGEIRQHIYFILEGRVRVSLFDEQGSEKSVMILNPGGIFGESCALEHSPTLVTMTTNTPCRVAVIHRDVFLKKISQSQHLSETLIYNLTSKLNAMISHIKEISFMNASERIATYLYKLSQVYGCQTEHGCKITIKFTHQEMADLSGTSRVTVSNLMALLDKAGTISKKNGFYYIVDMDHLTAWINKGK